MVSRMFPDLHTSGCVTTERHLAGRVCAPFRSFLLIIIGLSHEQKYADVRWTLLFAYMCYNHWASLFHYHATLCIYVYLNSNS